MLLNQKLSFKKHLIKPEWKHYSALELYILYWTINQNYEEQNIDLLRKTDYIESSKATLKYLEKENVHLDPKKDLVVIVLREWFMRKNRGLEQAENGVSVITSYDDYIEQMAEFGKYVVESDNSNIIFNVYCIGIIFTC